MESILKHDVCKKSLDFQCLMFFKCLCVWLCRLRLGFCRFPLLKHFTVNPDLPTVNFLVLLGEVQLKKGFFFVCLFLCPVPALEFSA